MATTEVKPSADKNPKRRRNPSLGPKIDKKKKKTKKAKALNFDNTDEKSKRNDQKSEEDDDEQLNSEPVSASEQLSYFLNHLESAIGIRVSSLELDSIKDKCIVELSQTLDQDVSNLGEHIKMSYGSSWRKTLCDGEVLEGKIDPGNPSVLVISSSALRSLELLRGLHSLTKQCPAVKLFAKHLKVEEQDLGSDDKIYRYDIGICNAEQQICTLGNDDKIYRYFIGISNAEQNICTKKRCHISLRLKQSLFLQISLLKKRVNIGSGTPSRIKKLIDIEALGLLRLDMIVLDMHTDVKGFSLFTLPQVRDELWDLYKNCFHQRVLEGRLRICLYGPKPPAPKLKKKKKKKKKKKHI